MRSVSVKAVARLICRSRSRCPSSSRPSADFSGWARVCQPLAVAERKGAERSKLNNRGRAADPSQDRFACPRKLDYQLRDCPHKRCVTVASQHLRALPNDLDVKEIVNL